MNLIIYGSYTYYYVTMFNVTIRSNYTILFFLLYKGYREFSLLS